MFISFSTFNMEFLSFNHMLSNALNRAYKLTKRIRNLQIHYIWYQVHCTIQTDHLKMSIYMENILGEYLEAIDWALLELEVIQLCLNTLNHKHTNLVNQLNNDKQFIWIQAVLKELGSVPKSRLSINRSFFNSISPKPQSNRRSYESVGLIPRSITRTLSRFQSELIRRSRFLVVSEFRLLKYQAIASVQYVGYITILSWIASQLSKWFFFHPFMSAYWTRIGKFLFINQSQEEEALRQLQGIEELIWLELVLDNQSQIPLQNLQVTFHDQTLDLVDRYTEDSIQILFNIVNSVWLLICITILGLFGRKRLAILNSWIQEIFYSLSDTMKAFFILLCTDLCIGFHSPHGWEILIAWVVEHLGFAHNPYLISCIVSTFPVILDTIFKYWIFRHLNRISPSIVVTYHTMNE